MFYIQQLKKNNIEILKLILSNPKIDINSVSITKSIKKEKVKKIMISTEMIILDY